MAERTLQKPLHEEDYNQIVEAIKTTAELENAINKARAAGVEVGDALERNRQQRTKLQSLKQQYFPGRA